MNEKLQAGLYKFNITPSVNGPIVGGLLYRQLRI